MEVKVRGGQVSAQCNDLGNSLPKYGKAVVRMSEILATGGIQVEGGRSGGP